MYLRPILKRLISSFPPPHPCPGWLGSFNASEFRPMAFPRVPEPEPSFLSPGNMISDGPARLGFPTVVFLLVELSSQTRSHRLKWTPQFRPNRRPLGHFRYVFVVCNRKRFSPPPLDPYHLVDPVFSCFSLEDIPGRRIPLFLLTGWP